jgi:sulfate adenylyltransferase (ADP) / ATP adenylyltransferase
MTLLAQIDAATARAQAAGALLPLQMTGETVSDGGVDFRVEWLSSLAMKDLAKLPRVGDKAAADFNPFLPFEQALHVADLSDTHVAILNKFPGKHGHFLIITRAFIEQTAPLEVNDFRASATALAETGGLFFYNSGSDAGASQRHRHMQIMPGYTAPIETVLPKTGSAEAGSAPLSFRNTFRRWDLRNARDPAALMGETVAHFYEAFDINPNARPYNLAMTNDWFLAVPRVREHSEGLSISGLSVVGLMGLRTPDQIEIVRAHGPMRMLTEVIGPKV